MLDARMLARWAEAIGPPARPLPDTNTQALQAVIARRRQLVEMVVMERNRLRSADGIVARDIRASIRALEARKKGIERQIAELLAADAAWRGLETRLRGVPGVGPVAAMTLIAALPELGSIDAKQIAALVRVAPLNRDSGQMRGHRTVWGGRAHVRQALYLAANVARQHNPVLRPFYERLVGAGKSHRVATTACARKLLVMLNAMTRDASAWVVMERAA